MRSIELKGFKYMKYLTTHTVVYAHNLPVDIDWLWPDWPYDLDGTAMSAVSII